MKLNHLSPKLFFAFALFPLLGLAQESGSGADEITQLKTAYLKKADSNTVEQVKLNFAVPDVPAFKALGNDPSNVLRPSSAQDLALVIGNFRSSGNFVIPKNFSLEVSPGLLVRPWYTLEGYQKNAFTRFVTKLRFSAGSNVDEENGVNSFALGLRTTLLDDGDFRKDKRFLDERIYQAQDRYTILWKKHRDEIMLERNMRPATYDELPQSEKDDILNEAKQMVGFDLDTTIANALKEYKKENWNANRIDFAYAMLSQSPDDLLSKARIQKHSFWLAAAIKPGKNNNWGQVLLSLNNNITRSGSNFYNEFFGNLRFYVGTNRVKGFLEGQYQNSVIPGQTIETLYAQIGLEVAVYKSVWLHFGTGVLNTLGGSPKSEILSNLNLYFSFPENFKLF